MRYLKKLQSINESYDQVAAICRRYNINNWSLNDDGTINVRGSVYLYNKSLTDLPLKFRNIRGYFDCSRNELVSLEGFPLSVGGDFDCSENELTSLEGLPKSIGGDFFCVSNNIKDFEGIGIIGGHFYCEGNPIFEIWKLFGDTSKIELLNDYDAIRGDVVILDRLNDFLSVIGKDPVTEVRGYKSI